MVTQKVGGKFPMCSWGQILLEIHDAIAMVTQKWVVKREYLINILIVHKRHFYFLFMVAGRLQHRPVTYFAGGLALLIC